MAGPACGQHQPMATDQPRGAGSGAGWINEDQAKAFIRNKPPLFIRPEHIIYAK